MAEKRPSGFTSRAWRFLHFVFLWPRRSSILRRRLVLSTPDCFKTLGSSNSTLNGERQFSCDETPIFAGNVHSTIRNDRRCLPCIPCINPHIDVKGDLFIYDHGSYNDSEGGDNVADDSQREQQLRSGRVSYLDRDGYSWREEEVDRKADEFITEFHKQIEVQRQMSYLRYKEMLDRGAR